MSSRNIAQSSLFFPRSDTFSWADKAWHLLIHIFCIFFVNLLRCILYAKLFTTQNIFVQICSFATKNRVYRLLKTKVSVQAGFTTTRTAPAAPTNCLLAAVAAHPEQQEQRHQLAVHYSAYSAKCFWYWFSLLASILNSELWQFLDFQDNFDLSEDIILHNIFAQ